MEKSEKKRKRKKKKKIWFIVIPLIFIMLIGGAAGAYFYVSSQIQQGTDKEDIFDDPEQQKEAELEEEKGLTNILLVGVDARPGEKIGRTDSIILATIDANSKRVKLTSFMRDMYVEIPGYRNNKINAAYAIGGPELLIKTINHNFNLNVQYFASINFLGFQDVVDKLGGINLEVKDYEVEEINKYIWEANRNNSIFLKGPGFQTLNGQQALSYSRIRKVGNNDYERTERQRRVLSLLIDKARKVSVLKVPELVTTVLPYVKTNVPSTKLLALANTVYKFGNTPTDSLRIPGNKTFDVMNIKGVGSSLVPDLEKNIALLDQFIYSSGGTVAGNMPVYMSNNFHKNDISLDKRGKSKPIKKIEVPEQEIDEEPPTDEEIPVEPEKDTTAPTKPIITLQTVENGVRVAIGGSKDDTAVSGYEYSFNNKNWNKYTDAFVINDKDIRKVYARAKDGAGNLSQVSSKDIPLKEPEKDTEPPSKPKVTQTIEGDKITFTFNSTDSSTPVTYRYSFDGNSWLNSNGSVTIDLDKVISYSSIYVIAVDGVGNETKAYQYTIKKPDTSETNP